MYHPCLGIVGFAGLGAVPANRAMATVTVPAVSVQPIATVAEVARSVMGGCSVLAGAPTEWRCPQVPRARLVTRPPISDDAAERDSTVAVAVGGGGGYVGTASSAAGDASFAGCSSTR